MPRALRRWTLEYLRDHLGEDTRYHTFKSPPEKNLFTYFFKDPMHLEMSAHACSPATDSARTTFREFYECHRQARGGGGDRMYFQAPMLVWKEDGKMEAAKADADMLEDLTSLDLSPIHRLRELGRLGQLARSTLFCSGRDALSPLHYDQAQNLFYQLRGRKHFLLFPPELGHCFYPYPVIHPMDMRARVDLSRPAFDSFPQLRDALGKGLAVCLEPGDLLFLPTHWWHQVQSLEATNISLNFWFFDEGLHGQAGLADAERVLFPLSPAGEVELARQLELFLAERCGGPSELDKFLRWAATRGTADETGPGQPDWPELAAYAVRRCVELAGDVPARRLLQGLLDPKRWAGLPKRSSAGDA